MFHFIRDLNMIYDNKDKVNRLTGKKLSLENLPVEKPEERKEFKPNKKTMVKNRSKSDSYNDWHELLQEHSTYPTPSNTESESIYDIPEMVSFVFEPKHHLKDINAVLSELYKSPIEDFAMEKYNFSNIVSADSDSCDSTKETLERLSQITSEFKNESDSNSTRSAEETLERLSSIAKNNEDDFYDNDIFDQIEDGVENPVEKIIYTVQQIYGFEVSDEELADEAEQIQCNKGGIDALSEDEDCQNVTILRCISEIQGMIPNSKLKDEDSDSDEWPKRKRHASQVSFQSNASGGSFAFPILDGGVTESPRVVPRDSGRQRQIVRAQRKPIWYPRWRGLTCCRAI